MQRQEESLLLAENLKQVMVLFRHIGEIGRCLGQLNPHQESMGILDIMNDNGNSNLPLFPVPSQFKDCGGVTKGNSVPKAFLGAEMTRNDGCAEWFPDMMRVTGTVLRLIWVKGYGDSEGIR